MNWEELNEPGKAKISMIWAYASMAFLLVAVFLPENMAKVFGLALILAWYFAFAKQQVKYVKKKNIAYEKRTWGKPLLLGVAGFAVFALLVLGISELSDSGTAGNRVLIVRIEESNDESFGIEAFKTALKRGGEVSITVREIRDEYPNFSSKYAVSDREGSYYIRGTVVNFIAARGWRLHEFHSAYMIFQKQ